MTKRPVKKALKQAAVGKPAAARTVKTAKKAVTVKKTVKRARVQVANPKKAVMKTKVNAGSVDGFLGRQDPARRADCRALDAIFRRATGEPGRMWGASIVGYGSFTYTYPSGRSGDWMLGGFSPRAQNLTLYLMDGFAERGPLLSRLGPHSTGKACLYIKRLADVDTRVLEDLVRRSIAAVKQRHRAA